MSNDNKMKGRGVFYGVIGVATLVVAIIGATFAYFTATQTNEDTITGNAASINFGLKVARAETTDQTNGGLIPMSNTMVEKAVTAETPCKDDNGNSVCQIYKITLTNESTASMFLDGYVTLKDTVAGATGTSTDDTSAPTTMRWAQVFYDGSKYSTGGTTTLKADTEVQIDNIDNKADGTGMSKDKIYGTGDGYLSAVTGEAAFAGNNRTIINKNYIRTSKHTAASYDRTKDLSDALVYDQYLKAKGSADNANTNDLYIVVWLHETGTNQTIAEGGQTDGFFTGTVTFNSAQGGEVSATFSGYTTVPSDTSKAQ